MDFDENIEAQELNRELSEISAVLAKKYEEDEDYERAFHYSEKTAYYKERIFKKQNMDSVNSQKIYGDKGKVLEYQKLCSNMDAVSLICRNIASNFDFKNLLKNLYDDISNILKLDILSIGICNEDVDSIEKYIYVESGEVGESESYKLGGMDTFGEYCLKYNKSILVGNSTIEYELYAPNFNFEGGKTVSLIYIPMEFRGKLKGFFSIKSYKKYNYNKEDVYKARIISEYLAIAMENSKYYNEVKYMATHDYLTGLLNRKELISKGNREFTKFKEGMQKLSVIIMDVDDFKAINDNYGHSVGDQVIVAISEILLKSIRNYDYVGRYGGEEFIIILPKAQMTSAYEVAQRIRKNIETNSFFINSNEIKFTASFGVFEFNDEIQSFEQGTNEADKAMYMAKKEGKNRVLYIR
ncbi:MAG: GGDEF domain-containing protein [Proteocatella sp.]